MGCGGCLTMAIAFVALIGGGAFFMTRGPVEAIRSQLQEIRDGRLDAAYGRFSRGYRARVSRQQFEEVVTRHAALRTNVESTFWNRSVQNDTALVSLTLAAVSGESEPVAYELVKEGGEWKISALRLGRGEAQSEGPEP